MAYQPIESRVGLQPIATVSTTQSHPLGTKIKAVDSAVAAEGSFIYAKASIAILQYDAVVIKANGFAVKTNEITYKAPCEIAFAQVAFAADEYGWFQQSGLPIVRLAPTTEKDAALYMNVSDGVLSGVTTSAMIAGLIAVTSVTTTVNAVTCKCSYPILVRQLHLGGS